MSVPRPALVLYGVAWLLVIGSAACIGVAARGFLTETSLLWAGIALGAAAIAVAVSATLIRRHG